MALLFLHPIGLDGLTWQFMDLPQGIPWTGYTLPSHGDRAPLEAPATIDSFADDVLRHVGGRHDIVGVSMGGAVAQSIALRHPDCVRSLLLASSTAGGRGGAVHRERAEEAERLGMAGVVDSHLARWFTADVVADGSDPGYQYARTRLLADDPEVFAASWRALGAHDRLSQLPSLRAPTTVLHCTQDVSSSIENKHHMIEAIPISRLVEIPGPHMVQLERPREFTRAVLDHLSWVDQTAGTWSDRILS